MNAEAPRLIALTGAPGAGKTRVANALVNHLGYHCIHFSAMPIPRQIQDWKCATMALAGLDGSKLMKFGRRMMGEFDDLHEKHYLPSLAYQWIGLHIGRGHTRLVIGDLESASELNGLKRFGDCLRVVRVLRPGLSEPKELRDLDADHDLVNAGTLHALEKATLRMEQQLYEPMAAAPAEESLA